MWVSGGDPDDAVAARLSQSRCTFTDAPEELARVALGQLGAARRLDAVAAGANACERLLEQLGPDAEVVHDAADLARLAP